MSYLKEKNNTVGTIYETNDLSKFHFIKGNRTPTPKHVNRLTKSIEEHGFLENPIMVNEEFGVIDGQHRLLAAGKAGSKIYYIVTKGYDISEVQTLNMNQRNWTKRDYLDGFVDAGKPSYIMFKKFLEANKEFSMDTCLSMCSNELDVNGNNVRVGDASRSFSFKNGDWVGGDFELAQLYADKIKSTKPYYVGYNKRTFCLTILSLFNNPAFKFEEFLHKLKAQPQAMTDCANIDQCKLLVEDIYNYRRRNKVGLRY